LQLCSGTGCCQQHKQSSCCHCLWHDQPKEPTTDKRCTREREAWSEVAHSRLILEQLCGGWGI